MKKLLSIILLLALATTLFAGCGAETAGENEIGIGINYELSGEVASYGQASVEGIELAIEEINAAGGINGKLIKAFKYDNKSDKSQATTLARKLMTQHKVVVASGSATDDAVTVDQSGVKEYAFRICFTDSYQGTAMANFALNNMSATKAVVLLDNASDYAKGLAANFTTTFESAGGTVVATEAFVAGDTDFNAIITKIKGQDFDVIFLAGYYNEAGLIIKQARNQGIDAPILGPDGFGSPELYDLAGAEALNNIFYTSHFSSLDKDPTVAAFVEKYKAKHGEEPNQFAALGYDLVMFIADGIKRAGSTDTVAIKDALEATTDFAGVTGSFSMDENHNPVKAVVIVGLQDGIATTSERVEQ